ncbi:DUF5304 domain-containing protein [Streptomyces sp. H27-D2]|uniref:DUF5304 domain-containing protein n=1 Tax=Streptomyces sp. H27-D2 TaxID=3046304 RepID=UPI002DBB5A0B|nr:DUF5304 domain-containing protein [Streptomyces sp. H27-D2]MEC4018959.1 DUF5304 domain-containing protein [Streptomyces sp. H27-D2]
MSDATERPADEGGPGAGPTGPAAEPDADAWARACAEDLAAEQARRRAQYGSKPASAAEELRKLLDAVADKVGSFQAPLAGMAAQGAVQQLLAQAKAAVEPVIERNPEVFDHLATAGSELLAAYRSAVEGQERRWTRGAAGGTRSDWAAGPPTAPKSGPGAGPNAGPKPGRKDEGPEGTEHIDLD